MSASGSASPPVVLVLGMHRSGTSLAARVINLCGVAIDGAELLMKPTADNERGYWEPQYLAKINDEILEASGGSWCAPPAHGLARRPATEGRMRDSVEAWLRSGKSWMWKDPRMAITLPAWRPFLPRLVAVIAVRNPLDVWSSLHLRDKFPRGSAYLLWEVHMIAALRQSEGVPRAVVHYEDLVEQPQQTIGLLVDFLTESGVVFERPADLEAAHAECTPHLRHHGHTVEDFDHDPVATDSQKRLYRLLKEQDSGRPLGELPSPPAIPAAVQESLFVLRQQDDAAQRARLEDERFGLLAERLGELVERANAADASEAELRYELRRLPARMDYQEAKIEKLLAAVQRLSSRAGNHASAGLEDGWRLLPAGSATRRSEDPPVLLDVLGRLGVRPRTLPLETIRTLEHLTEELLRVDEGLGLFRLIHLLEALGRGLEPQTILSVGSTAGALECFVALAFPDARVLAIDPRPDVESAPGPANLELLEGDLRSAELRAGLPQADFVYSIDLLGRAEDDRALFGLMAERLTRGGRLYLQVPFASEREQLDSRFGERRRPGYSDAQLLRLANDAALLPLEVAGAFWFPTRSLVCTGSDRFGMERLAPHWRSILQIAELDLRGEMPLSRQQADAIKLLARR